MLSLNFLFPKRLAPALDIIDNDLITKIECHGEDTINENHNPGAVTEHNQVHNDNEGGADFHHHQRSFFQVVGSASAPYLCFPASSFCTCPAYLYAGMCYSSSLFFSIVLNNNKIK
jgi:hypothetical protein